MSEGPTVVEVPLSIEDLVLLCEALDAYEYWQLGDKLPRNNGAVWIPGDLLSDEDRYWGDREPSATQQETIEEVREVRNLAARLLGRTVA